MKNKNIIVLCAWMAFVLLLIVFSPVIKRIVFSGAPISNHMTLEELQKQKIRVTYVETKGEESESEFEEYMKGFWERQLKGAKKCPNILIVKPTGNIEFNEGTILEEAKIKKVIKGELASDTIWLRSGGHSTLTYSKKKDEVKLTGMNRSFMQTDCEYLIFCRSYKVNRYSSGKNICEETWRTWFGCYNLTRSSDKIVPLKNAYYDPTIEFYVDDEKLLYYFNEGKRRLIEEYVTEGDY